jgi:hypothetical protein
VRTGHRWAFTGEIVIGSDRGGSTVLDEFLDPLSRCLDAESARRLLALRVPPPMQERLDSLAERANEGLLSGEERADYEVLINAADFVSILKLKARRRFPEAQ